jgi:hypothetical protein
MLMRWREHRHIWYFGLAEAPRPICGLILSIGPLTERPNHCMFIFSPRADSIHQQNQEKFDLPSTNVNRFHFEVIM